MNEAQAIRRALGLLLEGATIHSVQVDEEIYLHFRSALLRTSLRLTEEQNAQETLLDVTQVLVEFENYREESEKEMAARRGAWRLTVGTLMETLAAQLQVDRTGDLWRQLSVELNEATSGAAIERLRGKLVKLFQRREDEMQARRASALAALDRSTENHNAAGLPGGGAAIELVQRMKDAGRDGYVALFRLSFLDVVGQRFGAAGIQDCMMSVAAFLSDNVAREDKIYHWSESCLLAVCERATREDMFTAELERILAHNRDFTIKVGDRMIMLRIPIELRVFAIGGLRDALELEEMTTEMYDGRMAGRRV